jgi:hypothetical protein
MEDTRHAVAVPPLVEVAVTDGNALLEVQQCRRHQVLR